MAATADVGPTLRRSFTVMSSAGEITLVGGTPDALDAAVERLRDLEHRWSRFRTDSEISALNDHAGRPLRMSADTRVLIDLAVQGWRRTGGRFDPTLLAAVRRAGYDDDLARLPAVRQSLPATVGHHPMTCGWIVVDHHAGTVRLPAGAGFDAGGIGKGLAADLVSADLVSAGVTGGCVNVGGDLRVWGPGPVDLRVGEAGRDDPPAPDDRRWRVAAADRTIALTNAGVATSGIQRRAWTIAGRRMHHLIDPATLDPADTDVIAATVIAPTAWQAEIYSLAVIMGGVARARASLRRWDVDGLVVDRRGQVHATARLRTDA
jgi:thiamine biosynthesis lipoprotein